RTGELYWRRNRIHGPSLRSNFKRASSTRERMMIQGMYATATVERVKREMENVDSLDSLTMIARVGRIARQLASEDLGANDIPSIDDRPKVQGRHPDFVIL